MNSRSRSDKVLPRTMRVMYGHVKSEITKTTSQSPGLISPPRHPCSSAEQTATMPIAKRSDGTDRTMSVAREIVVSILPPK